MALSTTTLRTIADSCLQNATAFTDLLANYSLTAADQSNLATLNSILNPAQKAILISAVANSPTKSWMSVGGPATATTGSALATLKSATLLATITGLLAAQSPVSGGGGANDMSISGNLLTWLANNVV